MILKIFSNLNDSVMLLAPPQEPSAHQQLVAPGMGLGASQEGFLCAPCASLRVSGQAFIT